MVQICGGDGAAGLIASVAFSMGGKRRKKTKEKIEKGETETDWRTWTHAEGGES